MASKFRWHWLEMSLISQCQLTAFFTRKIFSNSDDMVLYLPIRKSHIIIYIIKRTSQRVYRVMKYNSIANEVAYNSFDVIDNILCYFNKEFEIIKDLHFEDMQKNYAKIHNYKRFYH